MVSLPSGTVTFVFSDIEGSTALLKRLGDRYSELISEHRKLVRDTFGTHSGVEIDTQGDAFFFAFARARDAVAAAVQLQRAHSGHEWPEGETVRVRLGLHTGEPAVGDEGYLGLDVVRAARLGASAKGGHVLLSETTRALLGNDLPERVSIRDLGAQRLKDIQHERVYELSLEESQAEFPPLKVPDESRGDTIEERFSARIDQYVQEQLEAAFAKSLPQEGRRKKRGCLLTLTVLAAAIAALVLIVQLST